MINEEEFELLKFLEVALAKFDKLSTKHFNEWIDTQDLKPYKLVADGASYCAFLKKRNSSPVKREFFLAKEWIGNGWTESENEDGPLTRAGFFGPLLVTKLFSKEFSAYLFYKDRAEASDFEKAMERIWPDIFQ